MTNSILYVNKAKQIYFPSLYISMAQHGIPFKEKKCKILLQKMSGCKSL